MTNDDGYQADGIKLLRGILSGLGDVLVVAPEFEQSACSHAITLHRPLRVKEMDKDVYTVDGTTSDCVLLASQRLIEEKPDWVFSGINHGSNMGDDVTYSGTVAGAFEGTLFGVRSIAISSADKARLGDEATHKVLAELIASLVQHPWPENILLNINLPASDKELKGVRITHLGRRHYAESVIEKTDPHGRTYFWIGGPTARWWGGEKSDFRVLEQGYISITPLHLDMTHYPSMDTFLDLELNSKRIPPGLPRNKRANEK